MDNETHLERGSVSRMRRQIGAFVGGSTYVWIGKHEGSAFFLDIFSSLRVNVVYLKELDGSDDAFRHYMSPVFNYC